MAVHLRDIGRGYKVSVSEAYKREDSGELTASDIEKCLPSRATGGKWIKRSDTEWQLGKKPIAARLVEEGTMIVVRHRKSQRSHAMRVWTRLTHENRAKAGRIVRSPILFHRGQLESQPRHSSAVARLTRPQVLMKKRGCGSVSPAIDQAILYERERKNAGTMWRISHSSKVRDHLSVPSLARCSGASVVASWLAQPRIIKRSNSIARTAVRRVLDSCNV